jgi:hypothetical protein
MTVKAQFMLLYAFIGLCAVASVLIGGTYLITGGEVGELPTLPVLMLAIGLFAAHALRAKTKADDDAR